MEGKKKTNEMSWTIKDIKAKGLQIIGDQEQIAISIKSNPGPSKYKNKRVEIDGHFFDSKKEAGRYGMLKLMQKKTRKSEKQLKTRIY